MAMHLYVQGNTGTVFLPKVCSSLAVGTKRVNVHIWSPDWILCCMQYHLRRSIAALPQHIEKYVGCYGSFTDRFNDNVISRKIVGFPRRKCCKALFKFRCLILSITSVSVTSFHDTVKSEAHAGRACDGVGRCMITLHFVSMTVWQVTHVPVWAGMLSLFTMVV